MRDATDSMESQRAWENHAGGGSERQPYEHHRFKLVEPSVFWKFMDSYGGSYSGYFGRWRVKAEWPRGA